MVTVSGTSQALPGTDAGSVKVTPFDGVPRQGPGHRRRTLPPVPQGRGHPAARLGRAGPAVAAAASGAPVELPPPMTPGRIRAAPEQPIAGTPSWTTPAGQPIAAVSSSGSADAGPSRPWRCPTRRLP